MLPETYSEKLWSSRFGSRVLESALWPLMCLSNIIHKIFFELPSCLLVVPHFIIQLDRAVMSWLLVLYYLCSASLFNVFWSLWKQIYEVPQEAVWWSSDKVLKDGFSAWWVSIIGQGSHLPLISTVKASNLQSFLVLQRKTKGGSCCFSLALDQLCKLSFGRIYSLIVCLPNHTIRRSIIGHLM